MLTFCLGSTSCTDCWECRSVVKVSLWGPTQKTKDGTETKHGLYSQLFFLSGKKKRQLIEDYGGWVRRHLRLCAPNLHPKDKFAY